MTDRIVFSLDRGTVTLDRKVGFGFLDARGREIGAHVLVRDHVAHQVDTSGSSYGWISSVTGLGTWFSVNVQATRNGVPYGASQRTHYFRSLAEVNALVERRLASGRKAAAKKATVAVSALAPAA